MSRFVLVPTYPGRIVLRVKYKQTCFAVVLILNELHCICFIKPVIKSFLYIFKARKFGMGIFWGLIFGPGIILGFVRSPRDF